MAIAWTLRHRRIASALIGAGNLAQLEERLAAISAPAFSADELAALDRYAVDASALWSAAPGNV
jgi:L-glyceraldehyde 3-phosphate reductase